MEINRHSVRALVNSGLLGDFMSTSLADQLKVEHQNLKTPLQLQLAVQGSRSNINAQPKCQLKYQGINEEQTFDITNISSYNLILGTPWMCQHQVCIRLNLARVIIGNNLAQPIRNGMDTQLVAHPISVDDDRMKSAKEEICQYAEPLCKDVWEMDLLLFCAVNHVIPLIDEQKIYLW